jgi:hypothetical protein
LTIYDGDKLPPFYIGSTSVERVKRGYHGSVRGQEFGAAWKQELVEHPELFDTIVLSEHPTRAEALNEEQRLHLKHEVVRDPRFINTATARGGFINRGYWTEEEKQRMSVSAKNRKMTPEGIAAQKAAHARIHNGRKNTEETKERMRQAALNRSPELSAKYSAAQKAAWVRRKAAQGA